MPKLAAAKTQARALSIQVAALPELHVAAMPTAAMQMRHVVQQAATAAKRTRVAVQVTRAVQHDQRKVSSN